MTSTQPFSFFMLFTKNFCRSQNKFADIRNKITGASCSKLSRYCAVIIAEENGIAYICRTTSGGTGKPIVETHGENGGWFRSPFLLPTKKGALLPPCISSYLHRLKYKPSINKKDKAKRDYQSSPTEGKRKKTCPNSRIYLFINICPMGMYSIVSHKVIKKRQSSKNLLWAKKGALQIEMHPIFGVYIFTDAFVQLRHRLELKA